MTRVVLRGAPGAPALLQEAWKSFERIPDPVWGRKRDLPDYLTSGLAVFGLKFPSLPQFDRGARDDGLIRENLKHLHGIENAPCDNSGTCHGAATRFRSPGGVRSVARNPGRPMSVHGLHKVREAVGIRGTMTNHGCRAVFSTWADNRTQFPRHVIEACLAHSMRGVEAHYNRAEYPAKRREPHQSYCEFLGA